MSKSKKEKGAVSSKERREATERYLSGPRTQAELSRALYLFCFCNFDKKNPTFKAHCPHTNELAKFMADWERAKRIKEIDSWLQ
jgi:hypothetical protein